jgi:signal transduction histidine kinase
MLSDFERAVINPSVESPSPPQGGFQRVFVAIRSQFVRRLRAGHVPKWAIDATLALVAWGATCALLAHGLGESGHATRHLDAVGALLAGCASVPLLFWRRAPLTVFVCALLPSAALMALGYPGMPPIGATIALYLLAASRDRQHPWRVATTATVVAIFLLHFVAFGIGHDQLPVIQVALGALVWAVAWFAGERTRLRRQELSDLKERAERAERDNERDQRLAVAEERARIGRDLHDSAAHAINVIAVQAGAARLLAEQDPDRSRTALETIEHVARETVSEIDQIVHALRDRRRDAAGIEPPHGLAALGSLVAQHEAVGMSVSVAANGTPRALGAAADQAAYRILQEALTNSARHGAGAVRVELQFGERALDLEVVNPVQGPHVSRGNGGHGVLGMQERALLLGGRLRAEQVNGSFRIHAQIPYGEAI